MPRYTVNFGAAAIAAFAALACNSTSSGAGAADTPVAAKGARALNAPDPVQVAADRGRISGDSTVRTWVVIASDFQCPFCKQWHDETYKTLVDEYVRSGKVRVAYLNFPLNQHRNAVPTANGAMCAAAQNRFWEYHDGLFGSQAEWSPMSDPRPVLERIARSVGVDLAAWTSCYDSQKLLPLIMADRDRAAAGGVQSTPTFLVGGRVLAGAISIDAMRPAIDSAIARDRRGSSSSQ